MTLSDEDRFNIELIKLLLQVAWGDEQLTPRERVVIQGLGKYWKVPEAELKALLALLDAGHGLPAPDFKLLRAQPEKVLSAAHALASADGRIDEDEQALIAQLASLLNVRLE